MIHVLHLVNSLSLGGAEVLLLNLLRHMPRDRFLLQVATILPPGELAPRVQEEGFEVIDLSGGSRKPFGAAARLKCRLQEDPPDILHAHHLQATILARWMRKRHRVPRLVSTHHFLPLIHGGRLPHHLHRLTRRWDDVTIAVSDAVARALVDQLGVSSDRVVIIPNGVDLDAAHPGTDPVNRTSIGLPPDAIVIGTVARHTPEKALDVLMRAAETVILREPRAHFVLVGPGGDPAQFATDLDVRLSPALRERLHLVPPTPDTKPLMKLFDVFCLPSRRESFGLAAAEAMAMGIPLVTSTAGGLSSLNVGGQTALMVAPDDHDALAGALIQILDNPEAARQRANSARDRVAEMFSIQRTAALHTELYDRLMSES